MIKDTKLLKKFQKAVNYELNNKTEEAIAIYESILEKHSYDIEVLRSLAGLYMGKLDYRKAVDLFERILLVIDDDVDGMVEANLAISLKLSGNYIDALPHFEAAIKALPDNLSIMNEFGKYYQDLGQIEKSIEIYDQILLLDKRSISALNSKAMALLSIKKYDESILLLRRALTLKANDAITLSNLIIVLIEANEIDEASTLLEHALIHYPEMVILYLNKAHLKLKINDLEGALRLYEDAIRLNPNLLLSKNSKAFVLSQLGLYSESIELYKNTYLEFPEEHDLLFKQSMVELLIGNFTSGWKHYEARLKLQKYNLGTPESNGKGMRWHYKLGNVNNSVYVYTEQGLGDVIQMSRYLTLMKTETINVVCKVQKSLVPLFKCMPEIADIIVEEEPEAYDSFVSMMSLPFEWGAELGNIPSKLQIDIPVDIEKKWFSILSEFMIKNLEGKNIGLVNTGNADHSNDSNRSILLKNLIVGLPIEHNYFLLQKDLRQEDIEYLNSSECVHRIILISDRFDSFLDTAAVCKQLDLIIGVDTSVIHLAGTLGCKTWLLLPKTPDWRLQLETDATPWYPSMRIFRQNTYASWVNVLDELYLSLKLDN